ncbi:MAG: protein kinase [Candidatus Ornithomonoglobus sp.]
MNYNNLCLNCFCEKQPNEHKCSKCGFSVSNFNDYGNCLPLGTLLNGNYIVGVPLGVGGFGITYKCFDIKVGGICAVKEFMPSNTAFRSKGKLNIIVNESRADLFKYGIKRFREEADMLRNFHHVNIIDVYDSFSANGTAYYVMEYCDGVDLRRYTKSFAKKLDPQSIISLLGQCLDALGEVHRQGVLHRDIAPDNIFVTGSNRVKLLDFGSARYEMEQNERNLSMIVKAGYAPTEQYGTSIKQGPYTDIYSLGATFYHILSGKAPEPSVNRVTNDMIIPLRQLRPDLPDRITYAIDKAMSMNINDRFQNVNEMKTVLGYTAVAKTNVVQRPQTDRRQIQDIANKHKTNHQNEIHIARQPVSEIEKLRFGAELLDWLIYAVVYFCPVLLLMYVYEYMSGAAILAAIICFLIFKFIVDCAFEMSPLKATPGKCICGIYVGDAYGRRISAGMTIKRNFLKTAGSITAFIGKSNIPVHDAITKSKIYMR